MEKKIKILAVLRYLPLVLGGVVLFIALVLGDNRDPRFFWMALGILPSIAGFIFLNIRLSRLRSLKKIRENWGKPLKEQRDFAEVAHYFRSSPNPANKVILDDNTWDDLNMDQVFALVDRTLTSPGASVLYKILRTPCTEESAEELQHRHELASRLQSNPELREKLQFILHKLGKSDFNNTTHLLWNPLPDNNPMAFIFTLLAIAAFLAMISPALLGIQAILLIMLVFSLNSIIHYRISSGYAHRIPAITSLAALLRCARTLAQADLPGLEAEQCRLSQANASAKKILRKTRYLFPENSSTADWLIMFQYIQIFFLVAVRSFYGALEEIKKQIRGLQDIYEVIGFLDALQAVASYREGTQWQQPVFTRDRCLKVKDIRHPLLANPTPNSIEIQEQGILVTGSNMAGKSTFLRTLGVNVVLAQSLYTCLAQSYTASYLQVASSINKADDITLQKSLYFAEAERLLNIIRPNYASPPALILIDELLSGTNYTERLAASEAILNYLKTRNVLVVVATHDLDLAGKLQGAYQCYHFSDKMEESNLEFDYTLKKGIAKTRNAIKLLDHLGYPREIIDQASRT